MRMRLGSDEVWLWPPGYFSKWATVEVRMWIRWPRLLNLRSSTDGVSTRLIFVCLNLTWWKEETQTAAAHQLHSQYTWQTNWFNWRQTVLIHLPCRRLQKTIWMLILSTVYPDRLLLLFKSVLLRSLTQHKILNRAVKSIHRDSLISKLMLGFI